MADLLVPRIQPTVVGYNGWLYVIGGRNSNKVSEGGFRTDKQSFDMDYWIRVSQSLWDVVVAFNQ